MLRDASLFAFSPPAFLLLLKGAPSLPARSPSWLCSARPTSLRLADMFAPFRRLLHISRLRVLLSTVAGAPLPPLIRQ